MIASFAHKWRKPWIDWAVTLFAPLFCKLSKRPRSLVSLFLYLLFASSVFLPSPHSLFCITALVVILCRQLGWTILNNVPSIGRCHILFLQIDLSINFVYQKLFLFCIPNASTRCYRLGWTTNRLTTPVHRYPSTIIYRLCSQDGWLDARRGWRWQWHLGWWQWRWYVSSWKRVPFPKDSMCSIMFHQIMKFHEIKR